ncbi:MAG TPA: NmrA family NAD(P)-binding protein [Longimicrobium sp.]|jgi:uncharacterized protein YbjT (DUF2867 family)|uniref:NmrA family NAD(P)-binding protein n=1 Tax=Longimicrobium sp. TaxID=2029185 RepID=UPI002EDA7F30
MSIVITTPTGQIGGQVASTLIAAGADVRLLARDAARLPDALRGAAEVREGSLQDAAFLRDALTGASALFLLIPPDLSAADWAASQLGIGRAAADAVRANGIQRVVLVSSQGADRDDLFAISHVGQVERMLQAVAPNVVSLRAGFFFENFLSAVPTIAGHGAIYMRLAPEARTAMVATRDIAATAARYLQETTWTGHHAVGVDGPADLSFAEAAAAIGRALGSDVRYVQATREQTIGALLGAGASEHVATEYTAMFEAMEASGFARLPRTAESTTPTTLEQWAAEVLAPAVRSAALVPA